MTPCERLCGTRRGQFGSRQDDVKSLSIKEMAYGEALFNFVFLFVCDEMIDCVLLLSRVAS